MIRCVERLASYRATFPEKAFFRPPASPAAIEATESAIGLTLPDCYKEFLLVHDGGFIDICFNDPTDPLFRMDTAESNSHSLFGCHEITKSYRDLSEFAEPYEWRGKWPFIPFCRTRGQEKLVFGPPDCDGEMPVIDATEQGAPNNGWGVLYPNFEAFLDAYVSGDGDLEVIGGTQWAL
jgi:hypothetical protein